MALGSKRKYKICRYLGQGVFEKCQTPKYSMSAAKKTVRRGRRKSDFGLSLMDKQRVRYTYGVSEKQFRRYVDEAVHKSPRGTRPADHLHNLLERRLDNVAYRLGIANSRAFARQLVTHGHLTVNGKKVDVPSYRVNVNDVIAIRDGSKEKQVFAELDKKVKSASVPNWLAWDSKITKATVAGVSVEPESFLNFQAVIEFYTK